MRELLRVLFIVVIVAVDDVLREVALSLVATRYFLTDRVRWIFVEKARTVWRRPQR